MLYTRFVVLLILAVALLAHAEKITIAVNDLDAQGVEPSAANIISDKIRADLINSGQFRVMERSEMQTILKEQGFQKSGACTDNACLVEIGQLLGVKNIVAGSVGKIEKLYSVSLRMINIQTGEIYFVLNEQCECPVKTLLSETLPRLTEKMISKMQETQRKEKMGGKIGTLTLSVSPANASLLVNSSPAQSGSRLELAAGEVKVTAFAPDYDTANLALTLEPDQQLSQDIKLVRSRAYQEAQKTSGARALKMVRILTGCAAVGALAGGLYFNSAYNKAYDDYRAIRTVGDHSTDFKTAQDKATTRNLFYGIAGGLGLVCGISFFF